MPGSKWQEFKEEHRNLIKATRFLFKVAIAAGITAAVAAAIGAIVIGTGGGALVVGGVALAAPEVFAIAGVFIGSIMAIAPACLPTTGLRSLIFGLEGDVDFIFDETIQLGNDFSENEYTASILGQESGLGETMKQTEFHSQSSTSGLTKEDLELSLIQDSQITGIEEDTLNIDRGELVHTNYGQNLESNSQNSNLNQEDRIFKPVKESKERFQQEEFTSCTA